MLTTPFTFQPTCRDEFEYRLGDHKLLIYAELQDGYRLIDPTSFEKWTQPLDAPPLTPEEIALIRGRFEDYLRQRREVFRWS